MKKLLLITIFLISNLAVAEDIPTLATHINKTPNWQNENAEIVYVGTRCSGVLDAVIWRFGDDTRPEMANNKVMAQQMGDTFLFSTAAIAEKINFSKEGYTKEYKYWMEFYMAEAKDNLKKNNNIFEGLLGSDFNTCKENIGFYQSLL